MRNPHPSWPTPLLAMGPVRLRPMGWLDDLLPLRPPSLWSGKSLYARSLRWQPDTADLSWLFDAYAMLGIELPHLVLSIVLIKERNVEGLGAVVVNNCDANEHRLRVESDHWWFHNGLNRRQCEGLRSLQQVE